MTTRIEQKMWYQGQSKQITLYKIVFNKLIIAVSVIALLFLQYKNNILSPSTMRMVCIAMAQSIYSYGIGSWSGAFNIQLNSLETTINSLIKISFKKPYRMSTVLLYRETEFGKRNPINVGIKMAMELNIDLENVLFRRTRYNLRTLVSTTSLAYRDNHICIMSYYNKLKYLTYSGLILSNTTICKLMLKSQISFVVDSKHIKYLLTCYFLGTGPISHSSYPMGGGSTFKIVKIFIRFQFKSRYLTNINLIFFIFFYHSCAASPIFIPS
ncbi:putative RNA-directed DNA polymerase [Aphis craccivora]|uniref:Putative RNA-directed DNA polymerase n=1 Tax=Aphis craccivora TaxID=307492 RepID=A0A6G0YJ16_APHCR|nr:putative RNA-directed DNA polymerase [Aphis craccivora]